MKASTSNLNLADYYYGFLKKLSKESKVALIEKLAQSLREDAPEDTTDEIISVESFFEAFNADVTATDILSEIRALKIARLQRPSSQDVGTF